jgi:hypothetical protein
MHAPLIGDLTSARRARDDRPPPPERMVWVMHQPTMDRRTQRAISLDDVRALGTEVRVLFGPSSTTADAYVMAARALFDAWDEFEDGDVVVSMGGDLHTVTMIDDILRQRGVREYVWARHIGGGQYVEFRKPLDETNFGRHL